MPPRFAVIIPHYNDTARLDRCLSALARNDLAETEVVVVDNGSVPPPNAIVARYPFARLVAEPGRGAALARNRGVAETTSGQLVFLDADCVPADGWLSAAKDAAGRSDITGGAIDVFDETPRPRTGAQAFETVFAFNYRDYILKKGFSVTANLITNRRVFEAVGPFVDGVSEDAEWCLRARAKGFRLALDEAVRVAHPTRPDWPSLVRKWRRINREMFALKLQGAGQARGRMVWVALALAMPFSAVAHLPRLLRDRRLSTGERLAGAVTLVRLRALRAFWMLRQSTSRHP
ncbi:MAG: glycosyltransferase family 2 protein [Paracoccaceae bacterium]